MFVRFGQILMIVAMLGTTGAHWLTLQTVAWTTMLANDLHNGSLQEAVTRTFDGKHLCCLCRQIASERKSEKETEFSVSLKKNEFVFECPLFIFSPPNQFELPPELDSRACRVISKPAFPRPDRSLVDSRFVSCLPSCDGGECLFPFNLRPADAVCSQPLEF